MQHSLLVSMARSVRRMSQQAVKGSLLLFLLTLTPADLDVAEAGEVSSVIGAPAFAAASSGAHQDIGRYAKRLQARAENSIGRFGTTLATAGVVWLWLIGSTVLFLLTAAVASVVDLRMVDMRHPALRKLGSELMSGGRLFFRVLRDRRTPLLARLPLVLGLMYWLMPSDLISDTALLPGFLDDLVMAIAGAKAFLYLCPDAVVARHAQNLAAEASA